VSGGNFRLTLSVGRLIWSLWYLSGGRFALPSPSHYSPVGPRADLRGLRGTQMKSGRTEVF